MGTDLTLVLDRHGQAFDMGWFLGYDRMSVPRDYELFSLISEAGTNPLPPTVKFEWYGDEGLEAKTEDPYGDPLRWIVAGELARVFEKHFGERGYGHGVAIMHYLSHLPPDTPVILFWH